MSKIFQPPEFIKPTILTANNPPVNTIHDEDGAGGDGVVADIQNLADGTWIQINESNTSPYIDVDIIFENVKEIYGVVFRGYYAGPISTHYVQVNLHDFVAASDEHLIYLPYQQTEPEMNTRTILLPPDRMNDFIDTGGNLGDVRMSILHYTGGGTNNHECHIEYVALLGRRFA